jgi:crotonobetainyl-CoA:carnitine CoA-transferase CaiB-like acyl-CoA transferase
MAGLLDGMRVLDLSVWRPVPHATQALADLGAEVLKLEPPGGDPMRAYAELYAGIARGKRSIEINLRTDDGRARALELAAEADVVCQGWRPGVADRLGVGYAAVAAVNPSVIYCSLTGYGETGPWRDAPGHDINFQALAGAMGPRFAGDAAPTVPRLPVADLVGGTMCALLISAAWAKRIATGEGEHIDASMADVVAWWVGGNSGARHEDAGEKETFGSPGYGVFPTRDGRWIALGTLAEPHLWVNICRALDLTDLIETDFATRIANVESINGRVAAAIAAGDAADVLARLREQGAPASPVLRAEETREHEQFIARELFLDTVAGPVPGLPALLARHPRGTETAVASLNAHPEGFTNR